MLKKILFKIILAQFIKSEEFRDLVRELIIEISSENDVRPAFKEFKKMNISPKDTLYNSIERYNVTGITFIIDYCDKKNANLKNTKIYESKNYADFFKFLQNFKPEEDYISGVMLSCEFEHNGKKFRDARYIINSFENNVYDRNAINSIVNTLIEWFRERPELLI